MRLRVLFVLMALTIAPMAFAGTYTLSDWCFYVNSLDVNQSCNSGGGLANVPTADPGVTDLLHLQADGTSTLTVTLAPGNYNVFGILNYSVDGNGTNEYATALGSLSVGQVYSVNGESGSGAGSLYTQGANGTLDNTNGCANLGDCQDVAVAIGYTGVTVPAGSTGTITFTAGGTPPPSGFNINQTNGSTGGSINLSTNIQISGNLNTLIAPVPEPGAMGLMGSGLGALLLFIRRRRS
jgi:hypothetical protein